MCSTGRDTTPSHDMGRRGPAASNQAYNTLIAREWKERKGKGSIWIGLEQYERCCCLRGYGHGYWRVWGFARLSCILMRSGSGLKMSGGVMGYYGKKGFIMSVRI